MIFFYFMMARMNVSREILKTYVQLYNDIEFFRQRWVPDEHVAYPEIGEVNGLAGALRCS